MTEKKKCEFVAKCSFRNVCDSPYLCDRRTEFIEKLLRGKNIHDDCIYRCQFEVFCGNCYQDPDCCDLRVIYEGFVAFKRRKTLYSTTTL